MLGSWHSLHFQFLQCLREWLCLVEWQDRPHPAPWTLPGRLEHCKNNPRVLLKENFPGSVSCCRNSSFTSLYLFHFSPSSYLPSPQTHTPKCVWLFSPSENPWLGKLPSPGLRREERTEIYLNLPTQCASVFLSTGNRWLPGPSKRPKLWCPCALREAGLERGGHRSCDGCFQGTVRGEGRGAWASRPFQPVLIICHPCNSSRTGSGPISGFSSFGGPFENLMEKLVNLAPRKLCRCTYRTHTHTRSHTWTMCAILRGSQSSWNSLWVPE